MVRGYRYTTDIANDDLAYHLDTEKRAYLSFAAFSRTLGDSDIPATLRCPSLFSVLTEPRLLVFPLEKKIEKLKDGIDLF
jgi:hypothetical protein